MRSLSLSMFFFFLAGCSDHASLTQLHADFSSDVRLISSGPSGVHGFAFGSADALIYSDSFANASQVPQVYRKLTPYRDPAEGLLTKVSLPAGIEFSENEMLLSDVRANSVSVYDSSWQRVRVYAATHPWNVTINDDGDLIALSYDGHVEKLSLNRAPTVLFAGLDAPFDIVATDSDKFWVSEQGANAEGWVTLRSRDGSVEQRIGPFDNPEGLLIDQAGDLWIADTGAGNIYRYSVVESHLQMITNEISFPIGGAMTKDGRVVFNGSVQGIYGFYEILR